MITLDLFPALLLSLGFVKVGGTYSKTIQSALLVADFSAAEFCYPEGLVIRERQPAAPE